MEENLKQQHSSIIKIALVGPESTGKTTLAKQLAAHFDTVWAPEFAREYLQNKLDETGQTCEPEDLLPIAIGQVKLENDSLLTANELLFCDTNVMVTKVFSEMYYNYCDPALDKAARKHKYDLIFLTDVDVPWEKDDLRDKPTDREETFTIFKNALIENNKPFITLSGASESRLEKAIISINNLMKAKSMGFSSYDYVQIHEKGIPLETIKNHLAIFQKGIQKANLIRPAIKDDGVIKFSDVDFQYFSNYFDVEKEKFKLKKFVPASGAASRMFKFLSEFLNDFDEENESINAFINRKNASSLTVFITGLEKFPFYETVDAKLRAIYSDFETWERDKKNYYFIKMILDPNEFDYSNKPKGILPFHKYKTYSATPIEEHLNESAFYANSKGHSNLHFTISEAHQDIFEDIIKKVKHKIEENSNSKIHINYSFQNPTTDTIAVGLDNQPFRNEAGKLVFRPAGHGALIDNLNLLDADVIFIKNIDNVIQGKIEIIALYKKALAGLLINLQNEIFSYLKQIELNTIVEKDIESIVTFISEKLNIEIIEDFSKYTFENKINYIKDILNKPIRICGMVKNEGEPGGGPFWVRDTKGNTSLQIIETAQIDLQNQNQAQILSSSTYFNPVDLVCGIKDYKGNKFDLHQFVDHSAGFIVEKNKNGKELKAYELPGLWNGAMAKWITVFVEVPLTTFNPVKTVNDLLKSAHQPQ
jgi:nicotinamide riboside kinase